MGFSPALPAAPRTWCASSLGALATVLCLIRHSQAGPHATTEAAATRGLWAWSPLPTLSRDLGCIALCRATLPPCQSEAPMPPEGGALLYSKLPPSCPPPPSPDPGDGNLEISLHAPASCTIFSQLFSV